MAASMVSGLLSSLFLAGLKRVTSLPVQKILRLNKIDQALRDLEVQSPIVKTAIADFNDIASLYYINFPNESASFFSELSRTGIIEMMVENAFLNRKSIETKSYFINLHNLTFSGNSKLEKGDLLYDRMIRSFSVTTSELTKDKVLYELIQSVHRDISKRLEFITIKLDALQNPQTLIKFDEMQPLLLRLAKSLQNSYKLIRIETSRGIKDVDINKIYIPPNLATKNKFGLFSNAYNKKSLLERELKTLKFKYNESIDDTLSNFSFTEIAESFRRIVVLGDPGGGKSTFCQKLCFEMAKGSVFTLQYGNENYLKTEQHARFPIRVVLRRFEQARSSESQLDLFTYIARDLLNYVTETEHNIKLALQYLLLNGRAMLAFDGLDEILDTSKRQEFVDLVRIFCDCHPLCPVLVTSRFVGYDSAKLPDDFEEVFLGKFDDDHVRKYINKFMTVVGNKSKEDSAKLASKFSEQTIINASDLRKNPLMLGLMASLFLHDGDVPSNRPEIYRKCAELMFEKWDQNRGIKADLTTDFDRTQIFTSLAAQMYVNPELSAGISKQWLRDFIQKEFKLIYSESTRAYNEVGKFLKFLTGRAWVLSEVGTEIFSFTHQTFLEYFFARSIEGRHDTVKSLLTELKGKIVKQEWNEVIHLAIQLKIERNLRKNEEVAHSLGDLITKTSGKRSKMSVILFSARCFEYLSPTENTTGRILELLCRESFVLGIQNKNFILQFFSIITNASKDRKDYIEDKISKILVEALLSNNEKIVSLASHIIGGEVVSYDLNSKLNRRYTSIPIIMKINIFSNVKEDILKRSFDNDLYARLAWRWYAFLANNTITETKLKFIYDNSYGSYAAIMDGLSCLVIEVSKINQKKGLKDSENELSLRKLLQNIYIFFMNGNYVNINNFDKSCIRTMVSVEFWYKIYDKLKKDQDMLKCVMCIRYILKDILKIYFSGAITRIYSTEIQRKEIKILNKMTINEEEKKFLLTLIEGTNRLVVEDSQV